MKGHPTFVLFTSLILFHCFISNLLLSCDGFTTVNPVTVVSSSTKCCSPSTFGRKRGTRIQFSPVNNFDVSALTVAPSSNILSAHIDVAETTTSLVVADGFDPAGFFVDTLGVLINGPGILFVPIGAALAIASAIAFLIISYAEPAAQEDNPDNEYNSDEDDDF